MIKEEDILNSVESTKQLVCKFLSCCLREFYFLSIEENRAYHQAMQSQLMRPSEQCEYIPGNHLRPIGNTLECIQIVLNAKPKDIEQSKDLGFPPSAIKRHMLRLSHILYPEDKIKEEHACVTALQKSTASCLRFMLENISSAFKEALVHLPNNIMFLANQKAFLKQLMDSLEHTSVETYLHLFKELEIRPQPTALHDCIAVHGSPESLRKA